MNEIPSTNGGSIDSHRVLAALKRLARARENYGDVDDLVPEWRGGAPTLPFERDHFVLAAVEDEADDDN